MTVLIALVAMLTASPAGLSSSETERQIERADAAFWAAFNRCDREGMKDGFTADVEFYHDKTGATINRDAVVKSLMDGPCGTVGMHLRRELVAGSLSYDPVPGFGGILTGRHRFYVRRDGEAERLDGEARFAVVWQIVGGKPQMRRVLSFGHGPAMDASATK